MKLFSLILNDDEYNVDIKKTYDSLSGDSLFYKIDVFSKIGLNKEFKLDIVVNNKYEHDVLQYLKEPVITQFSDSSYNIKYTESIMIIAAPLITAQCKGEMKIGNQWIYITSYEETALERSTFIDTLESIIQFK